MPLFFFDLKQGGSYAHDCMGLDLSSAKEARDEAARVLPQLVTEVLGNRNACSVVLTIRDQGGRIICRTRSGQPALNSL